MVPQTVTIKQGVINVVLKSDAKALDEVVVTAMGISREKKALGYAVQDVKSEQLTQASLGARQAFKFASMTLSI